MCDSPVLSSHLSIYFVFQIIFGTGDTLQAITASANVGFVRAAENQVKPFFEIHVRKNQNGYIHINRVIYRLIENICFTNISGCTICCVFARAEGFD